MLESLFLQILNMSITASYIIIFIILARLALQKVPKSFSFALWSVALFRLLCPFSFESIFSIFNITGQSVNDIRPFHTEITTLPVPPTVIQYPNNTTVITPTQRTSFGIIFAIIWLLGIAVLLTYCLVSLYKLTKNLKSATHIRENIYLSELIPTAFVLGIFRPKIYLPASLSDKEQEYILLHEKTHIKRFDHIVKLFAFLSLCLHWFNPLVWVSFFLSARDMEMSCDESVIKHLGSDIKKDYSSSLLSLSTGKQFIGGFPLAFGEGDTKIRIKNVLNYKKPAFWIVTVSIIAVVILGIGLMLNPKTEKAGFAGVNAIILDIDTKNQMMTVKGIDQNSVIGDNCEVTWEDGVLISVATSSNSTSLTLNDFSIGDYVLLFINEVQESYPTRAKATSIQLQPNQVFIDLNTDFDSVAISEIVDNTTTRQIKFTDQETINNLRSLLIVGELTNKESVNETPNQENYIHIVFDSNGKMTDYYLYQENNRYYLEMPYNGIFEINIDTLAQIVTIVNQNPDKTLGKTPADIEKFLQEISQSFQIKEGVARFIIPEKMPDGYDISQLSAYVSGFMPMNDGSNISLHAFEKEDEARSWKLGEEYIQTLFEGNPPDKTQVNAHFYLFETEESSRYNTTISKVFPLREDHFKPSVSVLSKGNVHTITFSDRFNDKLILSLSLPNNWSLQAPDTGSALFTEYPIEISAGGAVIGNLSYDTFEPYRDENGNVPYMAAYHGIMLGSVASWNNEYNEIYNDKITSVATCKPWHNISFPGVSNAAAAAAYSKGILAYNVNAEKYIAINLQNDVPENEWLSVAKSVKLS